MKRSVLIRGVAISLSLLVVGASVAQAAPPTRCGPGPAIGGTHDDVIVVGTGCTLSGAIVNGSVFVSNGRTLTATGGTEVFGSIKVDGGGLIDLDNVTVHGGVTVKDSPGNQITVGVNSTIGSLQVDNSGTVDVFGTVQSGVTMKGSGNVTVGAGASTGGISMTDSGDVTINASASAGEVLVVSSGDVEVSGSVASIKTFLSRGIMLKDGATVFPGGVSMSFASRSLMICGTFIGVDRDPVNPQDGSGGVTVIESGTPADPVHVLAVEATAPPCGKSQIEGSVIVGKGTGNVHFVGAQLKPLAGDLIVTEQAGFVTVGNTFVSDVKVEKLRDRVVDNVVEDPGDVTLTSVETDSDTTIAEIAGDVEITGTMGDLSIIGGDLQIKFAGNVTLEFVEGSSDTSVTDNGDVEITSSDLRGDMKITSNAGVTVMTNDFSLEDISITNNSGPVIVDGNMNLSLSIIENDDVTVTSNVFTDAEVSKNTGGVSIIGNTGATLHCSDNVPAPTGMGANTITEFATGQCAGF